METRDIKSWHAAGQRKANVESFESFDHLPDSANVRLPVVCRIFSAGPASIWRWSKSGRLPAPKKVGPRVTVWNVGGLRRVLEQI